MNPSALFEQCGGIFRSRSADQGLSSHWLRERSKRKMRELEDHVRELKSCRNCAEMTGPPVSGGAVVSKVMLIGQAPGDKEPVLQKPFAWTAGKTLFRWFQEACGLDEEAFRHQVYIAAVCRCFPGKAPRGGDRVPSREEIQSCGNWLDAEFGLLRPSLVLPVGKLAISQFLDFERLTEVIGQSFRLERAGISFDLIPLPHPSGASTWHRMEPGKSLTARALELIAKHPEFPLPTRGEIKPFKPRGSA